MRGSLELTWLPYSRPSVLRLTYSSPARLPYQGTGLGP